jgi:hypothetical protein
MREGYEREGLPPNEDTARRQYLRKDVRARPGDRERLYTILLRGEP